MSTQRLFSHTTANGNHEVIDLALITSYVAISANDEFLITTRTIGREREEFVTFKDETERSRFRDAFNTYKNQFTLHGCPLPTAPTGADHAHGEEPVKNLRRHLIRARARMGLTQAQAAAVCGVTTITFHRWEKGGCYPRSQATWLYIRRFLSQADEAPEE